MPDEAGQGKGGVPSLETLADKISWLMEHANPSGRGPLSAQDVSYLLLEVAGEKYSANAVWRLKTGEQENPGYRVIRVAPPPTASVPHSWSESRRCASSC